MSTPFLLPHVIDAAAERAADAVAVVHDGSSMTYAELARRSGQFAAALQSAGITRGRTVGVWAMKSIDTVVAIHGIQRAGAISVPVDPMAPLSVLSTMTRTLGLDAVVVDAAHADRVSGPETPSTLIGDVGLDIDLSAKAVLTWDDVASHDPVGQPTLSADDPAYMITTSGSTGEPKAIVHTHHSALRYAQLAADTYGLTPADRLANVAPFHFDQSTFELYGAPVAGATTVLVPELAVRFPAELSTLVERERVSIWYSVPTILTQLLHRGAVEERDLSSLRWVLFGGEVFPSGTLAELMGLLPNARFSNVYGPAEVNQCMFHHLESLPLPDTSIPIGLPWPDTEIRVVGDDAPRRGELHVRSATMMAGYWRRPDLTEAGIIDEVDDIGRRVRWYRTGDVVEYDADGLLHFCGRVDRQVKIRGNRVELEAVEAAISDIEGVISTAAVTLTRDGADLLVAIVEGGPGVNARAVRAAARTVLPPHAVPDEVMVVDALPRTQSGKIDNRAAADAARTQLEETDR